MNVDMLSELWADSLRLPASESPEILFSEPSVDLASHMHMSHSPGVAYVVSTGITYIDPASRVSLRAAVRRLEDFGLVRSENGTLSIHQLTRSIIRALRADREQAVFERIRATVYELIQIDDWALGEAVSFSRAMWAPQLIPALASLEGTAIELLDKMTDEEINRLAALLALTLRSARQFGLDMDRVVMSVNKLTIIILIRATHEKYDAKSRSAVHKNFYGLHKILVDYFIGKAAFDRSSDGKLYPYSEPDPHSMWLAIKSRLRNDTEWELAHHLMSTTQWKEQIASLNSPMNLVNDAIAKPSYYKSAQGKPFAQHKTFAQSSVEIATIHYHAGRWNDAIGALEHAYSCYLKIGADTECTRGVIDVARRLARVHLRAGQLNDASFWLIRAQWMFHQRSEVRPNGLQLRYRLRDRFLEAQLNQVLTQLELTNAIYRFEEDIPDADDATQKLHDFVKQPYRTADDQMSNQSRLEEAERAFNLTVRIGERRLLPEAQIHTIRLQTLANEGPDGKQLEKLVTWFKTESLSYQFDLLQLQLETFMAPEMGIFMHFGENEAESLAEDLSPNVRGQLLLRWQHRKEYTQRFYGAARKMWDKHGNRYWYARGLCACFLVARDAGHPQTWIDGLRSGLESAAIEIKRPDWIEKTYSYLETNAGFWLLGY